MNSNITCRLVGVTALLFSGNLLAQTAVPHTFASGQPARESEVNENFNEVEKLVDTNIQNITEVAQLLAAIAAPTNFQFVGFSSNTVLVGDGLFTMNAVCQVDFGPDSRMATSEEVVESTSQPILGSSQFAAWVRPVIVSTHPFQSATSGTSSTKARVYDVSGFNTDKPDVSCQGWSSTAQGQFGLAIGTNGSFYALPCDIPIETIVACSALQ